MTWVDLDAFILPPPWCSCCVPVLWASTAEISPATFTHSLLSHLLPSVVRVCGGAGALAELHSRWCCRAAAHGAWCIRAEPEMEGLLCDLLWADPSDDPGVTNIESLSDQVKNRESLVKKNEDRRKKGSCKVSCHA